jgi:molybdopterin/thiamine biosynthesis adenylyltransferase
VAKHTRYARLEALPTISDAGLAALQGQRVAVLGAGNIGGQLAHHLVLLGAGVILVDRDIVTEANLGTQGFVENQIGRPKADARAEWLAPLNPECRIEPMHADIRRLGLGALRDASLLCSCLDNRPARMRVNEIAVRLGIPWVDGALDGSGTSLFGRVACYDPRQPDAACYLCPYDGRSLQELIREGTTSAGCAASWWKEHGEPLPTLATSALGGAVASLQAIWSLSVLLGRPEEVAGREVYFDLGRRLLSSHRLTHNSRCLFDHVAWPLTPLPSHTATVAQTFAFADGTLGGESVLQLVGRTIVTKVQCPRCAAERSLYRAVDAIDAAEVLCTCGSEMHPAASGLLDRFDRSEATPFLERSWAQIGLPPSDVLIARSHEKELSLLLDTTAD